MSKTKKQNKPSEKKKNKKLSPKVFILILLVITAAFIILESLRKSDNKENNRMPNRNTSIIFKKHGELTFTSKNSEYKSKIDIEMAVTDQQRATGLMYRTKMEEHQGMLFVFPVEELQSFWMRNTIIPLDIIFVDNKKEIIKIHKNTIPFSESPGYPSLKPAIYVVEVNAGYTDKYNIKEGDKIIWQVN